MNYIFAQINHGFIIAILMGFLILLIAVISMAAPDLLGEQLGKKMTILQLPLIGFILSLMGVGDVPILFLLGIYPLIIGIIGLTGNLIYLLLFNGQSLTPIWWWSIRLIGLIFTIIFVKITGKLRKLLLKTHTVQLLPERLIGTSGEILSILTNGLIEISIYDEVGRFSIHVLGSPWERATDLNFEIGNKVYLVDLISPRHYSIVKFDSEDQLKVLSLKKPF